MIHLKLALKLEVLKINREYKQTAQNILTRYCFYCEL